MNKRIAIFTALAVVIALAALWLAQPSWLPGARPETAVEHAQKHLDPTYTCPMHREVHSDKPGACPICGMPLQKVKQEVKPGQKKKPLQEKKILYWHDPMVPQQKFDKPGKSPFMDMQLVPVYADGSSGEADDGSITISPRVVQNIGVRTAPVETGTFSRQVNTVGTVAFDERGIEVVESRASGWVEKLYVKAENDPVRRGQLLAEIYAPDLLAAQEEYLLALKIAGDADDSLAQAARSRLSLLGLTEAQIRALEKTRKPQRRVAFYSPIDGIVAKLGVRQGMAVNPGMVMFNLVDLSTVWVNAEIVEAQAAWITEGKAVEARVPALPGKTFHGKVAYITPEVMRETRTLIARIVLDNPNLRLKPGMYADLTLSGGENKNTLLVPTEAVIKTGKRSLIILAMGEGKFKPAEVTTGMEADGKTEIQQGLEQGQRVVASGQFLIDSESSLRTALDRLTEPESEPAMAMDEKTGMPMHRQSDDAERSR
ncbi:MAG: efflux RND transporter periplasmic adaptor subunit [Burkholderiales bacterium]|nr:efflux RND transporter periplasmic adaptor subunit [Burkholderiales bacterium]